MSRKYLFGPDPSQVSRNRDFGSMAWQSKESVSIDQLVINALAKISSSYITGTEGIGIAPSTIRALNINTQLTGGTTQNALYLSAPCDSGATTSYSMVEVQPTLPAGAYTVATAAGVNVNGPSIGAGAAITTWQSFFAASVPTATNIRSFRSNQVAGTGKYCLYMDGTADNYLAGNLLIGKTTATANAGDVQVSKGIAFPATQVACSDVNTLDDYEEGTFTPSYTFSSGSVTYTEQSGYYTKVGRLVTIQIRIIVNTITSPTGSLEIYGLPFAGAYYKGAAAGSVTGWNASTNVIVAYPENVSPYLRLYNQVAGAVTNPGALVAAGCAFDLIMSYTT